MNQATGGGSSRLDPEAMFLKKAYFPPSLWDKVFEGKMEDVGAKRKREEKASEYRQLDMAAEPRCVIKWG